MTRILIVEDSPTQAQQLQLILGSEGFEVEAAADGNEGLERIRKSDFDLVVSDILMPGLSGYELCRQVKADPSRREIPFILLTTLGDPLDIIQGLECGADNFITKPYQPAYLVSRIQRILENKRLRAEGRLKMGVEIFFLGRKFTITSDKEQILDLLISTFEDIVRTNQQLQASQAQLSEAKAEIEAYARQLEGRARRSEKKYRTLMERAGEAIVILDEHGTVLEANQQAAALAGRPAAEIIGRPSLDFVEPRRAAFVRSLLQRLDLGGSARTDDLIIERPDGSVALVEASGTDIQVGDERLRLVILRDITERKRAEAKLRESEDRFRRLAENAQDLIYRYQLLPRPGFEYVSPAATAMTGYTPEEHYADPELGVKIVHPEDRPIIEKMLQAEEVPEEPLTVRWMHKNGRMVWTEQRNVAIRNQSGKVAVIEGIARDVTERRKLEEQLRQAQKMEAVGQLAGGIAHDFNNLLTVITGYADMALPKLHRSDPLRQDIEEIRRAGQRAAALTRQLLAFSRRQIVTPAVLNLNEIVAEMDNLLRRTIGENIELVTVPGQTLGPIKADPGQIEQIIMNLVLNSRDAMPEGGKLTVETSNADLDAAYVSKHVAVQPGRYIMLAVSDTGCGMNEETQSRIFEPFFTTKEQGKGTGLGLATVYGIVKQCGGTISVYSEPGRGTTFKIFFPEMTGTEEAVQPEVVPARVPGGIETVLLVEDDEMVRRLSCLVLKEKGYNVLEARHGGEALLTCERHRGPIHLMVTDVVMPQMGGRELAERLAPLHPEMKILYLSGYASNAIVHQGTLLPGVAFLQKPFAPAALTRKVREVLDASAKSASLRTGL